MDQAPTILWSLLSDIGSLCIQPDAGSVIFALCLCVMFCFWLTLRLLRALLFRVAKGVVLDILSDEQVTRMASRRFINGMVALNKDGDFVATFVQVLWSDESKVSFKDALTELLVDERFVDGIANL